MLNFQISLKNLEDKQNMKSQTSLSKAFEINKNQGIYGTFTEIGAGQETVNFFYRAGLASQTVAKSMSAYDMTVSDEIYGKQNRYVCKNRLLTMLNREYHLLEKRLKKKVGSKTSFFVFATTAVTSSKKKTTSLFSNHHHAWVGLRFQNKPLEAFNDIIFHVNCLDKSRLQQYEALGILGVNLIYAGFYRKNNAKTLVSSLTENLSGSRIEIHGMICSGPAFKNFATQNLNLETLSQGLSSMAFFPEAKKSEFLSDVIFGKSPVILYGDRNLINNFKQKEEVFLKTLDLTKNQTTVISFIPQTQLTNSSFKNNFPILTAPKQALEELKELISSYTLKPITFIISENYFTKKMFKPDNDKYLLKTLGILFDKKTKLAVLSKNKDFFIAKFKLKQDQALKDYLVTKKQIIDLK